MGLIFLSMSSISLKIQGNFMDLILLEGFFVSMVKFLTLAQFPLDHLSHPLMPNLVSLFYQFIAFTYYVINRFISITT